MTREGLANVNDLAQHAFAGAANFGIPLKWITLSIPRNGQKPLTVRCRRHDKLMEYTELSK